MRALPVVAVSVLLAGLLLPGHPAAAEWSSNSSRGAGVALGTGAYVFLPYLVPFQDVSAELVLADRFAVGGQALFVPGEPSEVMFAPFVALGSPRSRRSAAYFTAALLPGVTAATLAVGCEGTLRGPVRLYGEVGAIASVGDSVGLGLPYGRVGIRLRF